MMKKGEFISKQEATLLSGVAVALMVFHHLFGFPERVFSSYVMLFDNWYIHLETMISYFGRICVSIFAFCSGYGMTKRVLFDVNSRSNIRNLYRSVVRQLKKFYVKYWIVFIIFIPIGFFRGRYNFQTGELIKNFLGISSTYNGEWWYVAHYVGFLLIFPLLFLFNDYVLSHKKNGAKLLGIFLLGIIFLTTISYNWLSVFLSFYEGMVFVNLGIFERVYGKIQKSGIIGVFCTCLVFVGTIWIRVVKIGDSKYDYIFAPILIFCIVLWFKSRFFINYIKSILLVVGKYSTYIWLTHTFFAYYYFQPLIYVMRYSIIIFIWCMVISLAVGFICDKIDCGLEKCVFSKVSKKSRIV